MLLQPYSPFVGGYGLSRSEACGWNVSLRLMACSPGQVLFNQAKALFGALGFFMSGRGGKVLQLLLGRESVDVTACYIDVDGSKLSEMFASVL